MILSQYKVAQAIKEHPDCPVVLEGLSFHLKSSIETEHFKKIFPKGLPENFEELTSNQKTALCEGGASILFNLGKISRLYRSVDFNSEVSKGLRKIPTHIHNGNLEHDLQASYNRYKSIMQLTPLREKEAIERAEEAVYLDYAEKRKVENFILPKKFTVLIVYGAGHNFKSLCDDKGFELERVDCDTVKILQKRTKRTVGIYQSIVIRLQKEDIYKKQ